MEARNGLAQAIRRVGARVYGVANGDTEDVVQEALARAISSGVSLEAEQWLISVASASPSISTDVGTTSRAAP